MGCKCIFVLSIIVLVNIFCANGMNVIDGCWKGNSEWRRDRPQLATCSIGFSGKMTNNFGPGLIQYKVTDPSDDPINPRPGTLRYGASMIQGKVWITFERDMQIKLSRSLLISSFTAIDARGVNIHIADNACLMIYQATDIIIHGLHIHNCRPQGPGMVVGGEGKVIPLGPVDGDGLRIVTGSKIWIDHNTLYNCDDGLLDVTLGSTNITVSNNWFREQNKVMLLGHDDSYVQDQNMKVTVVYNRFGPNCNQRMPRIRHGYAHVANNLYMGWLQYAIGGSRGPSVESEANLFIAPTSGSKEVTWIKGSSNDVKIHSVRDKFENGALFTEIEGGKVSMPNYNAEQSFKVADASSVRSFTSTSGALCSKPSTC